MEVVGSSLDRISTLPPDITLDILSRLPIRHALRTSILSKNWRYRWASIPELTFDDKMFQRYSTIEQIIKNKLVNAIHHVFLFHTGLIVEFTLFSKLDMPSEFDQIILYLSRSNTLEKFNFVISTSTNYKLPSSFFSMKGLQRINIKNCRFDPPSTFKGFGSMTFLYLDNVEITIETLKRLITTSPLLDYLYLFGKQKHITGGCKLTFVELFECLPPIKLLGLSTSHMKYFSAGGMPQKLPVPLVRLKFLVLGVCFTKQNQLFSAIWLINNSPNLETLYISLDFQPTSTDVVDLQSLKLDRLTWMEIEGFNNLAIEMKFVKLVLTNAPVLKVMRIELCADVSVDEEMSMLRDLRQLRASPSAKITLERHNKYSPEGIIVNA